MRNKTITLYKFEELKDEAKAKAIEGARNAGWYGNDWGGKWRSTLDKAQEFLPFKAVDWSVNPYGHSFVRITVEEDAGDLRGVRAWKYLQALGIAYVLKDTCPFTGYCGDECFLDPLRAFLERPRLGLTLADLMQECADSWCKGWAEDIEYQDSDEYIAENLEANEYEFDVFGNLN